MKVKLLYGKGGLDLDLTGVRADVLEPRFVEGLPDEAAGFREALRKPYNSPPLREIIGAQDRVAVVTADITRDLPARRLLEWLFAELDHVKKERVTIISGTGSHRANRPDEWAAMAGGDIYKNCTCVDHNAHDPAANVRAGDSPFGYPVSLNREYAEADKRVVLGFIEPHFMAGFSGGYKGIVPGVASIDTIMNYHAVPVVGDDQSTWGKTDGNPTQEHLRAAAKLLPPDFCVNVTLNRNKQITRFFCGETAAAHAAGCAFARGTAMTPCEKPYPIVIGTNSGYPLDQNLYQTVKGMSAAAQILEPGGLILMASCCNDGFPGHGNFKKHIFGHDSPEALLKTLNTPGFSEFDQWESLLFARILRKGRVHLRSELAPEEVIKAYMKPVAGLKKALDEELTRTGLDTPVAVLPEGPLAIPYLT